MVDSGPYQGAMLEGHVQQVKRPGKASGTAELQLAFDKISLANGRSSKVVAQVIEVIKAGASQGVGKVDSEGGVNGSDSTRNDVMIAAGRKPIARRVAISVVRAETEANIVFIAANTAPNPMTAATSSPSART